MIVTCKLMFATSITVFTVLNGFPDVIPNVFFGIKVDFRVASKYLTTARREQPINGKQRDTFVQSIHSQLAGGTLQILCRLNAQAFVLHLNSIAHDDSSGCKWKFINNGKFILY